MKQKIIRYVSACAVMVAMSAGMIQNGRADMGDHGITHAQPELAKQPVTIISQGGKKHEFSIEIAKTPMEQEVGEMFRPSLPDNGGMLFIWPVAQQSIMWMKNTQVPLDMIFIDSTHHIQAIAENTVPYSLAPVGSLGPVIATLELKGGITEKLGIVVGDTVETPAFDSHALNANFKSVSPIRTDTKNTGKK